MASATMTVTAVRGAAGDEGTFRQRFFDLTFSGTTDTYVTGGFSLNAHDLGLVQVLGVFEISFSLAAGTAQTTSWVAKYDLATGKIQLLGSNGAAPAALAEAATSVQVSTFVIRVSVYGF